MICMHLYINIFFKEATKFESRVCCKIFSRTLNFSVIEIIKLKHVRFLVRSTCAKFGQSSKKKSYTAILEFC